jgi:hypothetical protein
MSGCNDDREISVTFKPGDPRPIGAGRKPGQQNKATTELAERVRAIIGCDPLEALAKIAVDEEVSPGLRTRALAEVVQYIHPRKRATEVTAEVEARVQAVISGQPLDRDTWVKEYGAEADERNDDPSS